MKITMPMLEVFAKFNGDIDSFARMARDADRMVINDEQWYAVSELLQEAFLLSSVEVAPEFKERIARKLSEETECPEVYERLLHLAQQCAPTDGPAPRALG